MTSLAGLVALLSGEFYREALVHLPTIVLALVRRRPGSPGESLLVSSMSFRLFPQVVYRLFQKYEPDSPAIWAFLLFVVPAVGSGVLAEGGPSALRPLRVLLAYATFYTTLVVSVVSYRLSPFHPLARYPGPVLAKMSNLWFVSVQGISLERSRLILRPPKARLGWKGRQHIHYMNLHKKYGNVVRVGTSLFALENRTRLNPKTELGPNEIMLSDVSAIAPLLGPGGWGKGKRAWRWPYRIAPADCPHVDWKARAFHAPTLALTSINDHAEHARRRRTWTRGFSPTALRHYEEIISKRVIQLTETLSARKSVDLAQFFGYFS